MAGVLLGAPSLPPRFLRSPSQSAPRRSDAKRGTGLARAECALARPEAGRSHEGWTHGEAKRNGAQRRPRRVPGAFRGDAPRRAREGRRQGARPRPTQARARPRPRGGRRLRRRRDVAPAHRRRVHGRRLPPVRPRQHERDARERNARPRARARPRRPHRDRPARGPAPPRAARDRAPGLLGSRRVGARPMASDPAGLKIASYEIEEELAQGGMGVVYLARQPSLERRVVLKTLRRDLAEDATHDERFTREAQAAAGVHHPNVVVVYDCFAWRGERFIAQEHVDGKDVASVLAQVGRFDPRVVGLVALEVARGLEEIHARGTAPRAPKPANIPLGRAGEAKIADFGIALDAKGSALTQTGHSLGTPPYMSPEQLLGARVDYRSDLFSLGLVLFEMLAGRRPFAEEDPSGEALVRRIEEARRPPLRKLAPETSRALARAVHRCLRAKPKRRFASTAELRRALEHQLGQPPPPPPPAPK